MYENRAIKRILIEIKHIINVDTSLWSDDGACIAYTQNMESGEREEISKAIQAYEYTKIENEKVYIHKISIHIMQTLYLIIPATATLDKAIIELCVAMIKNVALAYSTHSRKEEYFRELLQGNVAPERMEVMGEKLSIRSIEPRILYLLQAEGEDNSSIKQTIDGICGGSFRHCILSLGRGRIILLKEVEESIEDEERREVAEILVDTISAELMTQVRVAYSGVFKELKDLKEIYESVTTGLEIGESIYPDKNVLDCEGLGLGPLIYGIPKKLSESYLSEILRGGKLEEIDEETMAAVHKFFKNNLNISETARQLFLHRNTLVYRLEKIQKKTGLDVRHFDDAMTFKIAIMVWQHLKHMENKE